MRKRWGAASALAVVGLLALPSTAFANMGPPSAILAFGLTVVAALELGIVIVETPVLKHALSLSWGGAVLAAVASNIVSALAGLPVAFIAGVFVGESVSNWMTGAPTLTEAASAIIFVLVFFVLSSLIEWPVIKAVSRLSWKQAARGAVMGNLTSHVLMLALMAVAATWPGV